MPPRYAYWTILVDDQPTAFRASAQEDLLPTLKRLQVKHPSAKMMWWQNGKLWDRRVDAQEAMHTRGELGRRGDSRQSGGGFRDRERRSSRPQDLKTSRPEWRPKPSGPPEKLEWKPKGEFVPAPKRADRDFSRPQDPRASRPSKPEWKPKGSFDRERKPFRSEKPEWKPRGKAVGANFSSPDRERKPRRESGKLEWKPKGSTPHSPLSTPNSAKRKWVPKEEYKKSQGIEAKKDKNWRPGGDHKDPRQKYKDAKKAKWGRFKQAIRGRWETKNKKKVE